MGLGTEKENHRVKITSYSGLVVHHGIQVILGSHEVFLFLKEVIYQLIVLSQVKYSLMVY